MSYLDENGVLYLWGKIKTLIGDKVDKVTGKELSSNDFTDDLKAKLNGISEGANKYTLPVATASAIGGVKSGGDILVNSDGQVLLVDDVVLTGIPKAPTAALGTETNQIATTEFVMSMVNDAIGNVIGFEFEVVSELPKTGEKGIIYLKSNNGAAPNQYDEYIWVNNGFEKIGSTAVDLSGYWAKGDLESITNTQIDSMCV